MIKLLLLVILCGGFTDSEGSPHQKIPEINTVFNYYVIFMKHYMRHNIINQYYNFIISTIRNVILDATSRGIYE